MGFDQDVLPRTPESEWKCPDCRPCSICKLVQDQDTILLCVECDTTFHRGCLPSTANAGSDNENWVCDECHANESENKTPIKDSSSDEGGKIDKSLAASPIPAAPSTGTHFGPWVFGTRQLELKGPPFEWQSLPTPDPEIPDAAAWTPDDVHGYFSSLGFQEQAALLRQNVRYLFQSYIYNKIYLILFYIGD